MPAHTLFESLSASTRYHWAILIDGYIEGDLNFANKFNDFIRGTEFVTVSIKLYLDVGNGDYIILRNFGGRIMSGVEFIEESSGAPTLPPAPVAENPPPPAQEKMLGI